MLFGSLEFVFAFLPVTLFIYHVLRLRRFAFTAKLFLVVASLFFYGWWNYHLVPLIFISIGANYLLSRWIQAHPQHVRPATAVGIVANLAVLAYYKYANFLVTVADQVTGAHWTIEKIILPLAISFFTFQQIAYLIESARDRKAADNLLDYSLFVLFFPHLIAGPITHHKEMLPQFAVQGLKPLPASYIKVGTAMFIGGLAKKVLLADGFALIADPMFDAAREGTVLATADAWLGALSYTLQLYFDFSGYSDMAIGLGLMFGILLPVNFASPYKSLSIIEFWRRWHISLSRFLRNYIYIPLGGNRRGPNRRYVNLMATMAIGGIWHGAGYTFLAWGILHGLYLIVNNLWRDMVKPIPAPFGPIFGWVLTMFAVVIAWVLFRAADFPTAASILSSMTMPSSGTGAPLPAVTIAWIAVIGGFIVTARLPNLIEIVGYPNSTPGLPIEHDGIRTIEWRMPEVYAAVTIGVLAAFAFARLPNPGVFIYFNF